MATIRFPAALHALPRGVTFVTDYASVAGFSPARVAEIELAVGEALTNICTHAYPGGEGDVEVQCTHAPGPRLCIDIVDRGVPFDPLSVAPPNLGEDPAERTTGGLGILLLRAMVDEMTYHRDHDQNILHLVIIPRPA
ncbi:MAG: ATP-binding protein [Candidatus Entotheonellia bacterium]